MSMTDDINSDPVEMARLREARAQVRRGEVHYGIEDERRVVRFSCDCADYRRELDCLHAQTHVRVLVDCGQTSLWRSCRTTTSGNNPSVPPLSRPVRSEQTEGKTMFRTADWGRGSSWPCRRLRALERRG